MLIMEPYLVKRDNIKFYSFDGLELVQREMLNLLKVVVEICDNKKLNYWLDGGSLIGGIRHNGFIPWDDDIDISLLKEDYLILNRELEAFCENSDKYYLYFKHDDNTHFCNFFASKINYFQRFKGSFGFMPIKLDIRPVNCVENSVEKREENRILRDIANYHIYNKTWFYDIESLNSFCKRNHIVEFSKFYNTRYGLADDNSSCLLAHPYFEFSSDEFIGYDEIFPLRKIKFEDILVNIPASTESFLTKIYGDFMELPKLEARKPTACEIFSIEKIDSEDFVREFLIDFNQNIHINLFGKLSRKARIMKLFGFKRVLSICLERFFSY